MNTPNDKLQDLGWSDWFAQRAHLESSEAIARVAAVDREQWLLLDQAGAFRAKLAGKFLHQHPSAHEFPCVGDWVALQKQSGAEFGVIHSVLERRTILRRRSAGSVGEQQMIAANVDCAVIVQSCHFDFNVKRLERYLVMVREGGAEPCLLLTKTDLVDAAAVAAQVAEIRSAGISAPVVTASNLTGDGLGDLKRLLLPGKTYCFVGSSGVGKSTLINQLLGRATLETGGVSATGEGRHTTTRRELLRLDGGAWVIDNPGMREFGILGTESDVDDSFPDISAIASRCRYRDCTHSREPGCAVREALESGTIDQDHFANYLKLRKESAFHQMSYVEKRHKDRAFGRFVKSVSKRLRDEE